MNITSLVSLGGAVAGLFNGDISIGGITLTGFEIPEKLNWGGAQKVANHRLPGGARVIDSMGGDDADIKWSGYFSGMTANSRARSIDALRVAGTPVPLSWPGFQRKVVITEFQVSSERNGFLLPYSITCMVLPVKAAPAKLGLLGQLGADISSALGLPSIMQTLTPVLQTAQTAVQTVQTIMPIAGVLTGGSPAFVSLTGALTSAQGVVSTGLAVTQASMFSTLAGAATTGTPLGTTSASGAIANLQSAVQSSQSLAGLTNMAGSLSRAASNLFHAGS